MLDYGAHVLVEKPLATSVDDCKRIAACAHERNLRVCVDHSLLYDIQVRKALDAVRSGAIGAIVSVDVLRSAEYPPYEGGALPPPYRSAGYPFRDLGVHQIYLMEAFLGPIRDIRCRWRSIGGNPNLAFDEWHAHVECERGYGSMRISFNVRPIQNVIIIQGTSGTLRVDQLGMFSTRRISTPLPKSLERLANAYAECYQTAAQVTQSGIAFLRKNIRPYHGLQDLVAAFYHSLDADLPVPVSAEEAISVVDWTERIAGAADADAAMRFLATETNGVRAPILVTGATGALGSALVTRLQRHGAAFRILTRSADRIPAGVHATIGDLGDPDAVDRAVRGARVVVHAGAATKGAWASHRAATIAGTQNIIDACLKHGVEQLIYISSLSVLHWAGEKNGTALSESSPLERFPHARGSYTRAKLEAEVLIRNAIRQRGLPAVILRPGQIFGGKLPVIGPAVARKVGNMYVVLGDGTLRLPLVYIEDVVDAICIALERGLKGGEVVHLVDERLPTQNELLAAASDSQIRVVHIPRPIVFGMGLASQLLLKLLKRESPLSVYRLRSALARRRYTSETAVAVLGWRPRVGVHAGLVRAVRGEPEQGAQASVTYAAEPA
jgi:nucleoside-diphosphate-sugar epimerase/predicted dehydrogenase